MTRYFSIIIALFSFGSICAQQAQIKVGYDHITTIDGHTRTDDYILLSSCQGSMFFNPTALWMDITSKDDAARQAYGAMASKLAEAGRHGEIPTRTVSMYVFKDFDSQLKTVYDDYSDQFAVFTEPFDEMQWEVVEDSTRNLLGYDCVMARTSYHGRDWTVWFAPEIPLHDGPWKFAGLPGLVLQATESCGMYTFIANGIETTTQDIPGMVRADWYHKEDRKKYLKGKYKHLKDPLADLAGGNLPLNAKVFVNGEPTTREELTNRARKMLDAGFDYLETDYHE